MVSNPVTVQVDLYEKLLWAFKNPIALYILIISSILGILLLVGTWRYFLALVLSAWILSPILLALSQYAGFGIDVGRLMLFLGTPMAITSAIIMPRLREIARVSRVEGGGEEGAAYSIEVNLDKALPAILITTLIIIAPMAAASTNNSAYEYYSWLSRDYWSYSDQERIQVLEWICLLYTSPSPRDRG